jgi:hypothetical protein
MMATNDNPKPTLPATAGEIRPTRRFLLAFYALAVVWGVRNIWFWMPSQLDLLVPLAMALCLTIWATIDARHHKHPIPPLSQSWFFLFAAVAVPGYVVWSRGLRGVGWVLLHFVCWYALSMAVMLGGGLIVFGGAWLRAVGG